MRLTIKMALPVLLSIIISGVSYGQSTENPVSRQQLDSIQKIKMMDSLQISSEVVDQVFAARDSMFSKVVALQTSESLNEADKEKAVSDARMQVNEKIKEILADEKYVRYVEMIRARLEKRGNSNQSPLAGETE